jgi:predicted XRE-type DNA-binding protein
MPKSEKTDAGNGPENQWYQSGSDNIFKDLGHDEEEAANLSLRSDLIIEIASAIKERGLSQVEAAEILKVKQPRISELMTGRISKFKVDVLIKYLSRLGVEVSIVLDRKHRVA